MIPDNTRDTIKVRKLISKTDLRQSKERWSQKERIVIFLFQNFIMRNDFLLAFSLSGFPAQKVPVAPHEMIFFLKMVSATVLIYFGLHPRPLHRCVL